jgi:hypothetical protein
MPLHRRGGARAVGQVVLGAGRAFGRLTVRSIEFPVDCRQVGGARQRIRRDKAPAAASRATVRQTSAAIRPAAVARETSARVAG